MPTDPHAAPDGGQKAAYQPHIDGEFVIKLLRGFRRGFTGTGVMSRARRKHYGDLIRTLEKRRQRERYS